MPTSQPLPPKESGIFKRILRCYEQKQYKNGLKFCKQILANAKFADHGETLAMKGLTLNCLGRKEEAYEHVKKGVLKDLQSHICWHVYGLLQRSDRRYDEAIKCYRNALKWDKDNLQILRDLSLLQIQMRDLEGYRETRYQLLVLRPTQRASWIGYAMAYHLLKNYEMAMNILEEFCKTQTQPRQFDYEMSELLLYETQILLEAGQFADALQHLQRHDLEIVDRLAVQEFKAELCLKSRRNDEAAREYWSLLDRNPENGAYYYGLVEAHNLLKEDQKLQLYSDIAQKYPKAWLPKRLPLDHATGENFRLRADSLLRYAIRKGMPALFVSMRPLYANKEKVNILEELTTQYLKNLQDIGVCENECASESERDPPTTLLWTYHYLAQHYDLLGDTERALDFVNKAVDHTITMIEAYIIKARIFKHAGNVKEAVRYLDEAQSLDTADRYINSKCAKYMLRANMIKEAEEMCAKFTREGTSAVDNLNEMQCMWFQTECAAAYQRLGKLGDALKKCHEIERHFTEITEDQFDFHTYCMRKMTLRAYVSLLRLEDVLRKHKFYFRMATIAIQIYISLYDKPISETDDALDGNQENLPPSELKKLKNKQRKKALKEEVQKQQKADEHKKENVLQQKENKKAEKDGELDGPKEVELMPEKLVKTETPLEEAIKFLKPLQQLASNKIETHLMAFEIYYRKGKLLLMLQSIKRGWAIDRTLPAFHECLVKFKLLVDQKIGQVSESVAAVLKQQMEHIYGSSDAATLNKEFLQANQNSLPHRLAAAKMSYMLDANSRDQSITLATSLSNDLTGITVRNCEAVLQALNNGSFGACDATVLENYRTKCQERFIHALSFQVNPPNHIEAVPPAVKDNSDPDVAYS